MIVVAATSLLWPKTMHSASPSAPNSLRVIESDDQVVNIFPHIQKVVTLQLLIRKPMRWSMQAYVLTQPSR